MRFHPDTDIDSLLNLLDDEDEAVAVYAMGELLDREQQLGDVLGWLQELPNALLRKRVHQLQAAITLRNRRRRFRTMLAQPDFQLKQGLIEVHLQWFDNDSRPELEKRWTMFYASAGNGVPLDSLEGLSGWMRKCGMTALPESITLPENYCIGTVLDNRQGAASLLCAMGYLLLDDPGVQIVRVWGQLLKPGGVVLIDSSDLRYLFEEEDGSLMIDLADEYYGLLDYQMEYNGVVGEPFDWLYLDFETLAFYAEENGFRADLVAEGDHYDYLAALRSA